MLYRVLDDNPVYRHVTHADTGIIMDQLDMLRTFVAVADKASFSEAALRLRISATAASRGISALGQSLGTALLSRTTRSVRLTEAGALYLERCRAVLLDLDEAALALRGGSATPGGVLVITAASELRAASYPADRHGSAA